MFDTKGSAMIEEKKLEGLGGWLIIVGLVTIFAPITIVAQIFSAYSEVFSNGTWEAFTAPDSDIYNPFWAPYIIGEIVINVGVVLAWLVAVFLFVLLMRLSQSMKTQSAAD